MGFRGTTGRGRTSAIRHLRVQASFSSFFSLSLADRRSGEDETWVHHALCGLERFCFFPSTYKIVVALPS